MQAATLVSTLLDDMRSFLMQIGVVDVTKLHLVHVPRTATSLNALEAAYIQLTGKATTYASLRQEVLDTCETYGGQMATPMDTDRTAPPPTDGFAAAADACCGFATAASSSFAPAGFATAGTAGAGGF